MDIIPPGSVIGIVGGGQLGRMLAVAAAELGYAAHIYCPEDDCPAAQVAAFHTIAGYQDTDALTRFAAQTDVVTFEFENIPSAGLQKIAASSHVHPSPGVLDICQHRVREKRFIRQLGIETAPFRAVSDREELERAVAELGFPCILKTCTMGYDGKGQWTLRGAPAEFPGAGDYIVEGLIDFAMEISVIAARNAQGDIACYPAVQNIHRHHILHQTLAPAPISQALAHQAEIIARRLAEGLNLIGLLAVEMFVTKDGRLLVNELAPRPHNSGHWTIDACATSQFEQAIRAICGLPLGSTTHLCDAVMTNLIGDEVNEWRRWLAQANARLHLYGKKEPRPGRKMGHVTELVLKA